MAYVTVQVDVNDFDDEEILRAATGIIKHLSQNSHMKMSRSADALVFEVLKLININSVKQVAHIDQPISTAALATSVEQAKRLANEKLGTRQ